jgi:hypothetical protein
VEERSKQVLAAAQRASDASLKETQKKAESLQLDASMKGALGGSRHLQLLSDLVLEGFDEIARTACEQLAKHDPRKVGSYRKGFGEIIDTAIPRLVEVFRDSGAYAPAFGRKSEHEQAELIERLAQLRTAAFADFDLAATAAPDESAQNDDDLKLALLRCFAGGKAHRINVLGRGFQPGQLETELGRRLSGSERAHAGRNLNDLIQQGLLEPTYTDITNPEDWLVLNSAGRQALDRGFLDALDEALSRLDGNLVNIRYGARSAALRGEPDSVRQAAHSTRELINQVIDALAPAENVKRQSWFKPDPSSSNGVTRKMKLKLVVQTRAAGSSENDRLILERSSDLLDAMYKKLSAEAHVRGPSSGDINTYLAISEMMLKQILL